MKASLVILFVVLLAGCDLFSTRSPEPPGTSSTFIWVPATTTEALMSDFSGALSALDPNNYIRAFIVSTDSGASGQSFKFSPTPGLSPGSQTVFANWSVDNERAWVAKLATLVKGKLTITFGANAVVQNSSTSANLTTTYTIAIPTTSGALIPDTVRGSFEMQFVLVGTEQGTKEWRIQSWSDFPQSGGSSATWTDLKLKLSS